MRLPIENCRLWFKFRCPQAWSQLARTGQLEVRFCEVCRKNVYRCDSEEEVESHRKAGHCIVIEIDPEKEAADGLEYIGECT